MGYVMRREQMGEGQRKQFYMERLEKLAAYGLFCIMVLSLLPMMYLGRYNHPTGDDYYYGAETKLVWEETGSVLKTIGEAVRGTRDQYQSWQGTYSAMLLMYLPPNIFGDGAYRLVTFVLLSMLCGGIFYFLKPILCIKLKGSTSLWLLVSSLLVLLCVQTVPSPGESFFWYNGSMYYTGYYALTLLFFGLVLRYMTGTGKGQMPFLLVLAVFLAGGNYVSLLPALLVLWLFTAYMVWTRSPRAGGMAGVSLLMTACFLVNVLAPGNQVRKDGMWSIPAWKAILKALFQGLRFHAAWMNGWVLLALLLVTPFLWRTFGRSTFRFRFPIVAVGLSFGLFCSMSCPTFYTMNSTGPARVVAIVYYGFLLSVFFSYSYLLGYLNRRVKEGRKEISPKTTVIFMAAALLLGMEQVAAGHAAETTVGKAVGLLVSGEAAAYEREYQERMRILEDETIRDVVFSPYENQPEMLYVGDFAQEAEDETNRKAAQYFHKDSLRVQY